MIEFENRFVLPKCSRASLIVLFIAAAPVFAQDAALRCSDDELGVINGTFDCTANSDAWRYWAPASDGKNGYLAEVVEDPDRVSSVLDLKRTEFEPSMKTGGFRNKGLWQNNIELPSASVSQFVLRFDYKLTSRVPFDRGMLAAFGYVDTCLDFADSASIELTSIKSEYAANDVSGGWRTAEIYLDPPTLCHSTDGLEFTIQFGLGIDRTCDGELNFARVRLDNVEIRAVIGGQEKDLSEGDSQPFYCEVLGSCGPCITQVFPPSDEEKPLQAVAGSNLVDARSYGRWCVTSVDLCGFDSCECRSEATGISFMGEDVVDPAGSYSLFCMEDLNEDGLVGAADLTFLLAAWGQQPVCGPPDLNGDGIVGAQDITFLLSRWGACD